MLIFDQQKVDIVIKTSDTDTMKNYFLALLLLSFVVYPAGAQVTKPLVEGTDAIIGITAQEEQEIKDKKEITIAPKEGSKEVFMVPADDNVVIKDGIKEIIAPKDGFKTIVSVESGGGKTKEVTLESGTDKTIVIKVVTGVTVADCSFYLGDCKLGNTRSCAKWEGNCKGVAPPTQCDEYQGECKTGDLESCKKWDVNCQPKSGTQCNSYLAGCKLGDKEACGKYELNCEEISVKTKERILVRDNKLYVNEKEIKIMPDVAAETALENLQTRNFSIELKDVGKPIYDASSKKPVRILGIFRAEMTINAEINAETGEIIRIKKPWWNFLAR